MKGKKLHRAWWILIGCILLQAGGTGTLSNCNSIFFSSITAELGVGNGAMSLFVTIRTILTALAVGGVTMLYKKIDLRVLLTGLSLLGCGCFAAQALFGEIWQWYLMAIPFGIACGGLVTVPATIVINNWFHKQVGLVLGIALCSSGIAGAVIAPLCSAMITTLGWRSAAALTGLLALVLLLPATLFILRLTPEEVGCTPYGEEERQGATIRQAKSSPLSSNLVVLLLCLLLVMIPNCTMQMTSHFSLFAQQEGLTLADAASFTSMCMLGNTLGKLVLGVINDRRGAWVTNGIACVALLLATAAFGSGSLWMPALCTGAALMGVSYSMQAMLPALLASQIYAGQYQKRYSLLMTVGTLVGAAASTAIGTGSDILGSYRPIFLFFAVCCGIGVLLSGVLSGWQKRADQDVTAAH
ncbi:MAG TPA: MFS transporter [Candidatus Pygmaiobacter gallistercoris]|nr:MFS transporter [Candidatus Pygmaiobacter gallistercoris]